MQIESVATKAGVAICDALSRTISSRTLSGSAPRLRLMFSTSTVASSTSMSRNAVAACRIADTQECNNSAHSNRKGANPTRERYAEKTS